MNPKKILVAFLLIVLYSNLQCAISQTIIDKIVNGNQTLTEFTEAKVLLSGNFKTKIFFSSENFEEKGTVRYRILLNEKIIADSLSQNFYELQKLNSGEYHLKVQAFIGNEYEAVPAELTLVFGQFNSAEKNTKPINQLVSPLVIVLSVLIIIFLVVIIILSAKLRQKGNDLPKLSDDEDELRQLNELVASLKLEIEKKNHELKHHKKIISELNKTIEKLEDANVNLIEQKESLQAKKIQLEELQKQKNEILAIKFHDIKNPANAIHGLVELLESYDLTATEQQEIMESIVASSANIVELVQSISETFARENFDDEYIFEMSSLQDIVDTVITINSAYAKKKRIRLINNSSKSLPKFKFDPLKIKEVIDNLVNNAIKYSNPDTDVIIQTFMTDNNFYIEVTDNGVGLSEKELPLIFEKGVKLSPKPTGNEKSSGLGMWIVKKIIQAHKGRIEAKSKLGVGTTFTIELPKNIETKKE
ncbi:MAG: hypothetical protein Fur0015_08420 [Ignavibacteriales bacterium]